MNLSQLRFVAALAQTGSFTAAAAACCVTQPTLSNGIAQLEDELGERLFLRTTRKVTMTAFGEHAMPYINEVLRAQATLVQQAKSYLNPEQRLIRIGTSPLIKGSFLALMLEPFRTRHFGVDVVLREMNMSDLYRMLDDGLLDFVVGVAGVQKGPWQTTQLYSEPLLYVPSGASKQAASPGAGVRLSDIAAQTYVMVPDACGLARATRELFRSHRRRLIEYSGEAMSYQVLEEWAALGIGAAILPRSKITSSERSAVPILDRHGDLALISFEAAWNRSATRSQHLAEFARHLQDVVPGIVAGLDVASLRHME